MIPIEKQAAHLLAGLKLPGGWEVVKKLERGPEDTGGVYSACYEVRLDGRRGFLKAFDYSGAAKVGEDTTEQIANILNAYNLERRILAECSENRCKNVIQLLATGSVEVPGVVKYPNVEYLILEYAEFGDVRIALSKGTLTLKWKLRSLHQLANGLRQIHNLSIAHQDLKPSNIVSVTESLTKLTDFGSAAPIRAGDSELPSRLRRHISGSWAYAPPELLYFEINPNTVIRRIGCDLYLLGSMAAFYFTNMNMTALIKKNLADSVSWENPETYGHYVDVKSYLVQAFEQALEDVRSCIADDRIRDKMMLAIRYLCNPDPEKRGHEKTIRQSGPNYNLERIVTMFDVIATRLI